MASGWNLWMWLQCIGVVSGCCKEIYRLLHISYLYSTCISFFCSCIPTSLFINPPRACTARVIVVVLYVCMCIHSYLLPHTLESQKRDTTEFIAIQGSFYIFPISLKLLCSKVFV